MKDYEISVSKIVVDTLSLSSCFYWTINFNFAVNVVDFQSFYYRFKYFYEFPEAISVISCNPFFMWSYSEFLTGME